MYANFFGLKQAPFSIAPDPRYLFMSERHREALAHLLYGTGGGGGFVLLTGEIGAGKTTVCRCFLEQIPKRCNVAYIFNPKLTVTELLKSVCDEFRIPVPEAAPGSALTVKDYLDPINEFLLKTHSVGQNNILIIDEAQHLSADVLEQLRLLTNLETNERKLLQIILIGQPELRTLLARPELEQLAQRVIARFHLEALTEAETSNYIRHRLAVAGMTTARPFGRKARQRVHALTRGVPRRINLLCDRALLGAYAAGKPVVDAEMVEQAAREVFSLPQAAEAPAAGWRRHARAAALVAAGLSAGLALAGGVAWWTSHRAERPGGSGPAAGDAGASSLLGRAAATMAEHPPGAGPSGNAGASTATLVAAAIAGDTSAVIRPAIHDDAQAWRELASLWGLDAGPAADANGVCAAAQASSRQLQCFKGLATLDLLRQLGRPGILTLRDDKGQPSYALLTGVSSRGVRLRLDGHVAQTLAPSLLAERWRGEFATFWHAPPGYRSALTPGQSGAVVETLSTQLAQVQGEQAPARAAEFGPALKARLVAFQVSQGLLPDGVAGPTTFMQINRALGVDEPRLPVDAKAAGE